MNKRSLLICSSNQGKIAEIREALADLPFDVKGLEDVGLPANFDVDEVGRTFESNALIKAMTLGTHLAYHQDKFEDMLCLADDSGLEVDAMGGRPGVHSARYGHSNPHRRTKLLEEMQHVPYELRGAQFHCAIALNDPRIFKVRHCEGISRGMILQKARGESEFGFDPLFFDETLEKTYAQMTPEEKFSVSHRGKALRLAREILLTDFTSR